MSYALLHGVYMCSQSIFNATSCQIYITIMKSQIMCICVLITFFLTLADGLLKMLYMILLHTQFRHPGAPKQTTTTSSGRSNYLYMTYLHV